MTFGEGTRNSVGFGVQGFTTLTVGDGDVQPTPVFYLAQQDGFRILQEDGFSIKI
jgi:hypothetical protein